MHFPLVLFLPLTTATMMSTNLRVSVVHVTADLEIEWDHRRRDVELIGVVDHVAVAAWTGAYESHPITFLRNAKHLRRECKSSRWRRLVS